MADTPTHSAGVSSDDLESPLPDGETISVVDNTGGDVQLKGGLSDMLAGVSGPKRDSLVESINQMSSVEREVMNAVAENPNKTSAEIAQLTAYEQETVVDVFSEYPDVREAANQTVTQDLLETDTDVQLSIIGSPEALQSVIDIAERLPDVAVMDGGDTDKYDGVTKWVELLDMIYQYEKTLGAEPTLRQLRQNHDLPVADPSAALTNMAKKKDAVYRRKNNEGDYVYSASPRGQKILTENGLTDN